MKLFFGQLLGLFVAMVFLSCNPNGGIKVTPKFDEEIAPEQNLMFAFEKDICPDSLLNAWDSTELIAFTPEVKGSFKWNSPSELIFSPSTGFMPGTTYTARITDAVFRKARKKYGLGKSTFSFHTAPLRVENARVFWTRSQNMNNVLVQVDVDFNYEVRINDATKKITLRSNGNTINANVITSGNGRMVSLQFSPLNNSDATTPLAIKIDNGIPLGNGTTVTQRDTTIDLDIPSRYNLAITGIEAQHTGQEGIVTVNTSQPLTEAGLKESIALEPNVPFEITMSDGGFIINSNKFQQSQVYQLTINKRVEGAFGGKLKANYEEQIRFGKITPSITFANTKGMYLSSQGFKNLALHIINVPKVRVTITKVYENNLENLMRNGISDNYHYNEDDDSYNEYQYFNTENLGDSIYAQSYETAKLPKLNAVSVLHLDFADKLKGYDGVYVITVASEDHRWIQHSKIVSLSDIGLIVKEDRNNMYVFANSIRNGTALDNVQVSFISTTNQRVFTATTDGDGVAIFNDMEKKAMGFKIAMVSAKRDDEFSFVWLSQARVETSRFDVGGRMPNATDLNAWIYAERNLYRPGETIHVSTIVRTEQWDKPGSVPVKLKLVMPNGKEFALHKRILNPEGSCETAFPLPNTAITGTYTLEVYTGNDVLLNSYNIAVEDFMPDRMKVQLKTDKLEYRPGDSVQATIQADNLFGTPAAGRKYECLLNLARVDFTAKGLEQYRFALTYNANLDLPIKTGSTNERGTAYEGFTIPATLTDCGMFRGNVMASVFDETGRPVHRYQPVTLYTQQAFVGIKDMDDYVTTRMPLKMMLIAADKNGVPQNNIPVHATLVKTEWHTVIQQEGSNFKYVSQPIEKTVKEQNLSISGNATAFTYTPDVSGEYELRVSLNGSNYYVAKRFYAYGFGNTQFNSFEVNNEGNVTIKPNQERYSSDETMELLFTTPFEGRMLVTVERNKIMKYFYLNTKNRSASLKVTADDAFVPNVYITATLFRPMDGGEMPLTVAHGFRSVQVENSAHNLPVAITVAEKSRSKTKQSITIKTTPNAYVTVAAVDEGILQVRNFETPNAYGYFYQKVALATQSYDIYPFLLPEINTRRSSTGGDGADQSSMRANPLFVNRVKNVSFWSGTLQADGRGMVKYDIDVPQFSGDIRVMAVAYKGRGFGSADKHVKVADPLIISAALPRFLSPKDEASMAVTISNTTAKDAQVTVMAATSGQLAIPGYAPQTLTIKANSENRVVYPVVAQPAIGTGKVVVTVKGLGETFTNETEMSVRPPASLQKIYVAGQVNAGNTQAIPLPNDFMPATLKGKFIVSNSPLVQFSKNLDALVQYPFGCVEQTTSAAFPQLYYADLVKSVSGTNNADMNPSYNVQQAILKLQSMQLSSGALAYWPSGSGESWWGSVYAAHFLLEAKKAGYEVNRTTVDRLLRYMTAKLGKKETEILYYNKNLKREIAAKEIPYSLYVLAIAGQADVPAMNYYKAHQEQLSLDSKYMLAAAYAVAGMPDKARQVLPPAFAGEVSEPSDGGSFYSYTRDQGMALFALLEINTDNSQVATLSRMLAERLNKQPYLNTQENVFGILAMGKMARRANQTVGTAEVVVNSSVRATTKGESITTDLGKVGTANLQLRTKGKGSFYYFAELSGISATGTVKEEDSYLKVRRSYFTRNGAPITSNTFKQNDLIVVRLTVQSQNAITIQNVAITDMLPAGFEIENGRLYEMQGLPWIKDNNAPDYTDIRDDRINMFTNAANTPKNYYYMVRAVSPGTYQLGPVMADAMYNGAYHSYNGAGVVKVE